MKRRWRRPRPNTAELDITPFMNLMVILVPFLLITAVFSRVAVLDLALPAAGESTDIPPPPVIVRVEQGRLRLEGGGRGAEWPLDPTGLDALRAHLIQLKQDDPQRRAITLVIAPALPYERLVAVMDTVRRMPLAQGRHAELFPDIALEEAGP